MCEKDNLATEMKLCKIVMEGRKEKDHVQIQAIICGVLESCESRTRLDCEF